MRPIRLAFLVGGLTRGGAELQMIALTERLSREGFEIDFVVRSGSGPLEREALAAGAAIHVIGQATTARSSIRQRYSRLVGRNARWITLARRKRYDIVDAWLHPADVVAALTRPVTGIPVVMSARLGRSPRRGAGPVSDLLESTVNRLLDVVVANADVTARDAMALQRVPSAKIRVLRGGVQLPPRFSPSERKAQRARLSAYEGDFVIGCVGNFRPMKRQDLLIEAFARLLPGHPNLRLALIGDGHLRPRLEKQIDDLGVADRVVLYGTSTDMPPLYNAFDLLVQASNSEGLPNVLLEASAAGLPIVATAAGGTNEVIGDGETGLLVPVDDVDALAGAVERAIADEHLRRRLGGAARRLVERDYGMDRFAGEYADLYREQLALKHRSRGSHP